MQHVWVFDPQDRQVFDCTANSRRLITEDTLEAPPVSINLPELLRNWNSSLAAERPACSSCFSPRAALGCRRRKRHHRTPPGSAKANGDRIQPYTFVEEAVYFTCARRQAQRTPRNSRGDLRGRSSLPEAGCKKRQTLARERAGPKSSKDGESNRQKAAQAAAPRGRANRDGRRAHRYRANRELLTLFENRLKGEEEIRGRKAWVIEATPWKRHIPVANTKRICSAFRRTLLDRRVNQSSSAHIARRRRR